eukprot:5268432-Pleurochrysis_carterae.AAC.3
MCVRLCACVRTHALGRLHMCARTNARTRKATHARAHKRARSLAWAQPSHAAVRVRAHAHTASFDAHADAATTEAGFSQLCANQRCVERFDCAETVRQVRSLLRIQAWRWCVAAVCATSV